jgi:hypothetical protein
MYSVPNPRLIGQGDGLMCLATIRGSTVRWRSSDPPALESGDDLSVAARFRVE